MRVSCPECGAEYQFDSSAIPSLGYDAQCTNCSTVFFVEPEPTGQHAIPDLDRIVTVGCPNCSSQYQFPAKDIPSGGYDAQCTQCNEVFYVSDELDNADNRVIGIPEPSPAADLSPLAPDLTPDAPIGGVPEDPEQEEDEDEDEPGQQTLKVRLRDDERAALRDESDAPESDLSDAPELDPSEIDAIPEADASLLEDIPDEEPVLEDFGVPEPPLPQEVGVQEPVRRVTAPLPVMPEPLDPGEPSIDTEPFHDSSELDLDDDLGEQFSAPKRRALRIAAVLAVALAVVGVGWFFFVPDPADSEAFLARLEKGQQALRLDTDAGYREALAEFRSALEAAPDSAEARALFGLAKVMRGANVEERGRFLVQRGQQLSAQLEQGAESAADLEARISQLATESRALQETGRKDIDEGFGALSKALEQAPDDLTVLDSAALYYSLSDGALERSREMAQHSLELRGLSRESIDWTQPPSPWLGLALGRVHAKSDNAPEAARRALTGVLAAHSDLHRARFALAALALDSDALDAARAQVDAVLALKPEHERAELWTEHLDRLEAREKAAAAAVATATATEAVEPTVDEPKEAALSTGDEEKVEPAKKKRKRRKKRSRKRRKRRKR